jgi:hypothetical protein
VEAAPVGLDRDGAAVSRLIEVEFAIGHRVTRRQRQRMQG